MRLLCALIVLSACASPPADLPKALQDPTPITQPAARITVLGLGCPQCASNIDLQLLRVRGVSHVQVDLGTGLVDVTFAKDQHPSVLDLATAVRDSGFTVVNVEGR